jgi:hypothetical protein
LLPINYTDHSNGDVVVVIGRESWEEPSPANRNFEGRWCGLLIIGHHWASLEITNCAMYAAAVVVVIFILLLGTVFPTGFMNDDANLLSYLQRTKLQFKLLPFSVAETHQIINNNESMFRPMTFAASKGYVQLAGL